MGESYPHLYGISIHAPAKGATIASRIFRRSRIFQSTLPRRERPGLGRRRLWLGNFNPRSREGSDILADALGILTVTISIHAPAKGATSIQSCRYDNRTDFNPRSREGSDTARNGLPPRITISIHAPAKGATAKNCHNVRG